MADGPVYVYPQEAKPAVGHEYNHAGEFGACELGVRCRAPARGQDGRRAKLGQAVDASVKRQAAAILEVLAGARTPTEAATVLTVSLPRYYQLESRALAGLVAACVPKPKGRVRSSAGEVASLRQQNERLQREVTRQQTLVRAAQRTVGLPPPAPPPVKTAGKKRRRRATARALGVARRLQAESAASTAAAAQATS